MSLSTEKLKQLPIVVVHRRYLDGDLQHRGNRYYAHCPWHGGANEGWSLVLYPDKNTWWCFGCSQGGSSIDLVARVLNVDFVTAIRIMAADFGIALPGSTREERAEALRIGLLAKFKRELEARFK